MSSRKPPRKTKLNALLVQRVRPAAKPFLIWDTRQAGLALAVQPTGTRAYKVIYRSGGRPRWLHLGNAGAISLSDARRLAAKAMLAVIEGHDPAAAKRAQRTQGTFADLATRYVADYAKRKNRSWLQAARLVRRNLLPRLGQLQAAAITRADVKATLARIAAPAVANQTLAAASAIFSWAQTEELLTTNPCRGIARNPTASRERILSASELPQFWSAFATTGLVTATALKVLLLTGQRPGEVAAMRREHIVDGWWEMPGAPVPSLGWPGTKNGESHRVWLPASVQEMLRELSDDETLGGVGRVFSGGPNKLSKAMREISAALGVARATPHDLRRTHGSTVTALGFGRDAMNRIQNHRDGGIATVYDRHGYAAENMRVMEAVAAHLIGVATGEVATTGNVVRLKTAAPQTV